MIFTLIYQILNKQSQMFANNFEKAEEYFKFKDQRHLRNKSKQSLKVHKYFASTIKPLNIGESLNCSKCKQK